MASESGRKIYSAFFLIEGIGPEVNLIVENLMKNRRILFDDLPCKIIGSKLIEDEAKLLFLLEAKRYLSEEEIEKVKDGILSYLLKAGVKISSSFVSEIEDVIFEPSRDSKLVDLKYKITFLTELFDRVEKILEGSKEELCEIIFKLVDKSALCDKFLDSNAIKKALEEIKQIYFDRKWLFELKRDTLLIALTRLFSIHSLKPEEVLKLYSLMKIMDKEIYEIDKILKSHELIELSDKLVTLTEEGLKFINQLTSIYNIFEAEKTRFIEKFVADFIHLLNSSVELVLRRDGTVEDFFIEKIILSILNAGLNPTLLANSLSSILSKISKERIITTDELSKFIVDTLIKLDEKGEIPAKYLFQIKTSQIVFVREKDKIIPLTYNYLNELVREVIKNIVDKFIVPESIIKSLSEELYDNLKLILAHPPLYIIFQNRFPNILLEKEEIKDLVKIHLKTYFPLINKLKTKEKTEVIKELIETSIANIDTILDIIVDIKQEEFLWSTIYDIINETTNIVAIFFNILPSWSIVRNISLLEQKIKQKLSITDRNERFLRRLRGFLSDSRRVVIRVLRKDFSIFPSGQLERYLRFCKNLLIDIRRRIENISKAD